MASSRKADQGPGAFPDLKGQAPLRQDHLAVAVGDDHLFLTSKVRLHCDRQHDETCAGELSLFLTSKVRLHCDVDGDDVVDDVAVCFS